MSTATRTWTATLVDVDACRPERLERLQHGRRASGVDGRAYQGARLGDRGREVDRELAELGRGPESSTTSQRRVAMNVRRFSAS
jgi:hypothetical protein